MPKIEKSVSVNAEAGRVFEVLQQAEQFPQFLPYVKGVSVVENTGEAQVLDWAVTAPGVGMEVRWRSRHTVHPSEHRITIQPEGSSIVSLSGEWQVVPSDAGSELKASIEYQANVPPMFAGVAQKAVDEIITGWLNGFKKQAEG